MFKETDKAYKPLKEDRKSANRDKQMEEEKEEGIQNTKEND